MRSMVEEILKEESVPSLDDMVLDTMDTLPLPFGNRWLVSVVSVVAKLTKKQKAAIDIAFRVEDAPAEFRPLGEELRPGHLQGQVGREVIVTYYWGMDGHRQLIAKLCQAVGLTGNVSLSSLVGKVGVVFEADSRPESDERFGDKSRLINFRTPPAEVEL